MPLPPLSFTPHLSRLLAPGETVVYTAKLHPLYGWPWLLAAILCSLPAFTQPSWGHWFILPATALFAIYLLPFRNWQCAVTNKRLLLRFGRFGITVNDIPPDHINHVQLKHNLFLSALHTGHVTLNLIKGKDIAPIQLNYLWHPMTFLEALETLTMKK
jgi:hypothetical protein